MKSRLKIAIIAGEESGDQLGADLVAALHHRTGRNINLIGVGGMHLVDNKLKSFFDPDEIALMGLGDVLRKLPHLICLIRRVSTFIVREKPDCLIIVDSPDFTHRVACRVRQLDPSIPIIKYVAPSVWAWRPKRAKAMRAFIDHVLVILPFEVLVMKKLQGPPATYVGHRLLSYPPLLDTRLKRKKRSDNVIRQPILVVLPGSRYSEIRKLMPVFGETIKELTEKLPELSVILPTLPKIEAELRKLIAQWSVKPLVVVGENEKWSAFSKADAALSASGTVSLELALCGIPTVLAYKADWFSRAFIMPKITIWSAALPNIIADEPIVPEYFNEFVRPSILARQLERHITQGAARTAQLEGFKKIANIMHTDKPSGELAVKAILPFLKN
ncbi:MAG: lipid-A-disaccharide synthase [Candidatus Tokpelaia sp. JSC189]|nr:MAG: lipid-A-disaccharide synthase [Candidatus Tokpelaia sp. JSC189]